MNRFRHFSASLIVTIVMFSCTVLYAAEGRLRDGAYEGRHSFVTVAVTIEEGEISEIEMVRHGGGGEEYAEMIEPLIGEIVRKQSTEVDAVTGATVSSENLKRAVSDALRKASLAVERQE
jgi:uncharacterized protein with FMN-binding domain